jgi:hypothetical protein
MIWEGSERSESRSRWHYQLIATTVIGVLQCGVVAQGKTHTESMVRKLALSLMVPLSSPSNGIDTIHSTGIDTFHSTGIDTIHVISIQGNEANLTLTVLFPRVLQTFVNETLARKSCFG